MTEKPRASRIDGSATFTTDTSRMTMNCARQQRTRVQRFVMSAGDCTGNHSSDAIIRSHADLLDERLGGRLHRRPRGRFRVDGPQRRAVPLPPRAGGELGGYLLGRRLYETMLVWETEPTLRDSELRAAFADVWCAIPKVVFSRTLDS